MSSTLNIIPTLDSQSILTDPRDILGYTLRFYCSTARSVSDNMYYNIVSIQDTISRYQNNPTSLATQVTKDLTNVLNRFYPSGASNVDVSTSSNGDGTYNLKIQLSVITNGSSYALGADVSVNSNGMLSLKWHPQL